MVTLDIEDSCIRIIVVEGKQVEKAASLPLEPGLVEDGIIVDKATVSQLIKELMAAHDITEKQVVASISGIHSIYRVFSLPRLSKGMLAEAVKREMPRVLPVPPNELYIAWQEVAASDSESTICLVGSPRNTVDAMSETLHQAGLQCQIMGIKPLALTRLADEKDAIIINVQSICFDIVVMIDGIPEILRSLPFHSANLPAPDKVATIQEELDRTIAFFESSRSKTHITSDIAVFISGELKEILTGALGYRVKPLPEWLSYPEGFNVDEYAVNIGLVLKEIKVDSIQVRVNINVIPEAYLPKPRPIIEIVSWAFIIVAIAVIVPLAILTRQAVSETSALETKVSDFRVQVQSRQGAQPTLEELQTKVAEAKATRDVFQQPLDDFEVSRAKINGDLSKVTSLLPGIVDLTSINYDGTILTITGSAPDEAMVLSYVRVLRDTERFSSALISKMQEVEYNEWSFTLTLE